MVKISYAPADELVVHEILQVSKEDLLRERVTPAGTMPLCWCDGVLFSFSSLPMSDDVTRDYLKGKIHWLEVHFAPMEKFTPILALNEEEYKGSMNIRVIDTTVSRMHKDFVKWLKSNIKG
ncbi:MAG: hypothetical protein KGH64_04760 [Candidatus Micrarchaeota archaeon]|nr:hypothetical protein [Candidatus Micrarchaeota archaeon]MDE1859054.1 hypothetical protein [Candidatus Micrarchaeota archaeon]